MVGDVVKIKGDGKGLLLEFNNTASFEEIFADITEKLKNSPGFFLRGTLVRVPRGILTDNERIKLQKLFQEYGLICRLANDDKNIIESANDLAIKHGDFINEKIDNSVKTNNSNIAVQQMLVVDKTLRGGEEIRTDGSVMVLGNVNPGAQIIAGGSIDIRGTCRGMVHAGAGGDVSAFIIADKLLPTQIRIADFVARSPDGAEESGKTELASVKDGQIVIATVER